MLQEMIKTSKVMGKMNHSFYPTKKIYGLDKFVLDRNFKTSDLSIPLLKIHLMKTKEERMWTEKFSFALRQARLHSEMTIQKAAEKMKVEARQFERWERGESEPNAYTFERLIHTFRLDEDQFHVTQ